MISIEFSFQSEKRKTTLEGPRIDYSRQFELDLLSMVSDSWLRVPERETGCGRVRLVCLSGEQGGDIALAEYTPQWV